jgi:hypothetical protein
VAADITVHEHDIRGALARPGARDSAAVSHSIDLLMTVVVDPSARALGLGPLQITAVRRSWCVGAPAPTGGTAEDASAAALASTEPLPPIDLDPVGTLSADGFELFRALSGRRSPQQVRGFNWSTDPAPYLTLFGQPPFTQRATDLDE